jgi:hypothetical protein
MMSLQKWTPFLWGQDRLGAPLALLARPIHHPLYNLLVQAGIMIWLALLAPPLVARLAGMRQDCAAVGTLVGILLLGLMGRFRLYDLLWIEPYAQSLSFGAAGLLTFERRSWARWITGAGCLFLGHYLNLALILPLLPLALLRPITDVVPQRRRRIRIASIAAVLGAFLISLTCTRMTGAPHEAYAPRPLLQWGAAYQGVASAILSKIPTRMWVACTGLVIGGAVGLVRFRTAKDGRALIASGCLVIAAACHFLVLVPSGHILADTTSSRYAYMSLILLLTALSGWGLAPWLERLTARSRLIVQTALLAALLMVAAVRYGPPSLAGVTRGLLAHSGAIADDIVAGRARFLLGGYWRTYPALYLANLKLYEQGKREFVWGLTEKAVATRQLWRREFRSGATYAMVKGDEKSARFYLRRYRVPSLEEVASTARIRLLREVPATTLGRHVATH